MSDLLDDSSCRIPGDAPSSSMIILISPVPGELGEISFLRLYEHNWMRIRGWCPTFTGFHFISSGVQFFSLCAVQTNGKQERQNSRGLTEHSYFDKRASLAPFSWSLFAHHDWEIFEPPFVDLAKPTNCLARKRPTDKQNKAGQIQSSCKVRHPAGNARAHTRVTTALSKLAVAGVVGVAKKHFRNHFTGILMECFLYCGFFLGFEHIHHPLE